MYVFLCMEKENDLCVWFFSYILTKHLSFYSMGRKDNGVVHTLLFIDDINILTQILFGTCLYVFVRGSYTFCQLTFQIHWVIRDWLFTNLPFSVFCFVIFNIIHLFFFYYDLRLIYKKEWDVLIIVSLIIFLYCCIRWSLTFIIAPKTIKCNEIK